MNGVGDQLLAGAGFAQKQHGVVQRRHLPVVAAGHKADIEPVRKRLLEYFTIPEPTDERLKRARRRLATLMY